jgi:hypothetical protein
LFLSISPGYAATERNFEAAERKWFLILSSRYAGDALTGTR